eukprot:c10400_g1_i1 orf=123-746(+)
MAAVFSCARRWLGASLRMHSSYPASPLRAKGFFCTASAPSKPENVRLFAQHTFYKGKAALTIQPGRPTFKTNEEGAMILEREGSMFLEFAPSTGPRQYDWKRKQVLALSVVELGTLLGLTMSESCEFYHDPHMGSSNAGMVRKSLKVEPMPDKTGFFFNISVANKLENVDANLTVPVTKGEFAVMRSSFNLGAATDNHVSPDLEWSK